ncbi:hypothetical protein A0J61_00082 [Choanephora cucurbitarum]|uniref:Uncharacterized protein n=1 Tax=Choanephora cucurbitarum TaxID=101091 RepID=A0A1C7NRV6_9FUNG|nr:hypothetical protein A0J61_00082 [Choanephora cucurbitarum]
MPSHSFFLFCSLTLLRNSVKLKDDISLVFSALDRQEYALDPTLLSLKRQPVDPRVVQKAYDRLFATVQTIDERTIPQVTIKELNENHDQFTSSITNAIHLCGFVVI